MEETSTPADFLDHEPSKAEKAEVSFLKIADGTLPFMETTFLRRNSTELLNSF